jgi:hypothetical protein
MAKRSSDHEGNQVIAVKLLVYGRDDDEYFFFITPEAFPSVNDWMTYRRECRELINEDSWIIRNMWDSTPKAKGNINHPKNLMSLEIIDSSTPNLAAIYFCHTPV